MIGVFPDNYGGAIEFQRGIVVKKSMLVWINLMVKVGFKMKMFWIHGFLRHYGLLLL